MEMKLYVFTINQDWAKAHNFKQPGTAVNSLLKKVSDEVRELRKGNVRVFSGSLDFDLSATEFRQKAVLLLAPPGDFSDLYSFLEQLGMIEDKKQIAENKPGRMGYSQYQVPTKIPLGAEDLRIADLQNQSVYYVIPAVRHDGRYPLMIIANRWMSDGHSSAAYLQALTQLGFEFKK